MKWMESHIIESESLVIKIAMGSSTYPSSAGHVESCVNPGGPSPKAKYSLLTDSEQVP